MSDRTETVRVVEIATNWLHAFESALVAEDMEAVAEMFVEDSYWRDLVAFTWHLRTFSRRDSINSAMHDLKASAWPQNFRLAEGRTPPRWVNRAGVDTIEAIFCFETKTGRGSGVLRLVPTPGNDEKFACWVLLTALDEIKGHEEQIGARRPRGAGCWRARSHLPSASPLRPP